MSIAARTAAHVHVGSLLAVAANLRLLEAAWIAAHHHVALVVRIRHVVVFLFADSFSAVGSHWPTGLVVAHAARVRSIRQRMIGAALIMHCLVLGRFEAAVNALGNHLVEGAAHLLLRLIIVNHALSMCLARRSQIILVVSAVTCAALGEHRILQSLVVRN